MKNRRKHTTRREWESLVGKVVVLRMCPVFQRFYHLEPYGAFFKPHGFKEKSGYPPGFVLLQPCGPNTPPHLLKCLIEMPLGLNGMDWEVCDVLCEYEQKLLERDVNLPNIKDIWGGD